MSTQHSVTASLPAFPSAYSEEGSHANRRARPSLSTSTTWMLAGRVTYNLCQFGILATFARLGSTETVGQFVLGLAVTAPIFLFCNLQLRLALATDVRGEHSFADYLMLRNVTSLLALASTGMIAVCLDGLRGSAVVIIAIGISKVVESFSDLHYGRLQRCEAIPVIARSLLIRGPTSLLAVLLTYWATQSLVAACLAMAGVWLVVLLMHDIPGCRAVKDPVPCGRDARLQAAWHRRLLSLAWEVLPLGLAAGLFSLEANVPRYTVGTLFGTSDLGVFGAILYLMLIGQTLVMSLACPTVARLAHLHGSGQVREFRRILMKVLGVGVMLGFGLTVVMVIGGAQILNLLYGADYAKEYPLLVLVSLATATRFSSIILTLAVQSMRRFKAVFAIRMLGLVATAGLCVGFATLFGLKGVGWALLLAATLQTVALAFLLWRWLSELEGGTAPVALEADFANTPQDIAL